MDERSKITLKDIVKALEKTEMKVFKESSVLGVLNGTVTFIESK